MLRAELCQVYLGSIPTLINLKPDAESCVSTSLTPAFANESSMATQVYK